jgi:hypothetical protein
MQQKKPQVRKVRCDRGIRLLTVRDVWVLRWVLDQYAVRVDQVQQLLSRQPANRNKLSPGSGGITDSGVLQVIARWREAPAWVEYERIHSYAPGWIWLTTLGERLLESPYTRHNIRESRLQHRYYINAVRLDIERRHPEYRWVSERSLLSQFSWRGWNEVPPHLPDGEIWIQPDRAVGVEVELSPKEDREVDNLLMELLARYWAVWYFVSDHDPVVSQAWRVVVQARRRLAQSLQRRVQIIPLQKVGVLYHANAGKVQGIPTSARFASEENS